jgi:hypothetical protein
MPAFKADKITEVPMLAFQCDYQIRFDSPRVKAGEAGVYTDNAERPGGWLSVKGG